MLRFLADENFNGDIVRGLRLRKLDVDIVRVQDVGLSGWDDDELLEWAAANGRIVLSHDCNTMIAIADDRVENNLDLPGLFIVDSTRSVGQIIEELAFVIDCSEPAEWNNRVVWLPL